jgi:hypothetical protein
LAALTIRASPCPPIPTVVWNEEADHDR